MSETIGEIVNLCDVDTGSDINRNKDMRRVGFGKKLPFPRLFRSLRGNGMDLPSPQV